MNLAQYKINGHLTHDAIVSLSHFTSIDEAVGAPGRTNRLEKKENCYTGAARHVIDDTVYDYDFNLDGEIRIVHCESTAKALEVPASIEQHSVTEIGEHAFCTCYALQDIVLPRNVRSVGKFAFMNTALESFCAPPDLRVIGRSAFYKCTKLNRVTLNDGLEVIGCDAFRDTALHGLSIPASVRIIGQGAFRRSKMIFSGPECTLKVDDGNSNYSIDDGVLYEVASGGWTVLQALDDTMVVYEGRSGTIAIADKAFAGLVNLNSVKLPEGVLAIGEAAFKGCSSLSSIVLPETLRCIGKYAFQDTALTAIRIPAALEEVGTAAFYTGGSIAKHFEPSISNVEISEGNESFYLHEGILCHRREGAGTIALLYIGNAEHLVIPREITRIGMYAFLNCTSIHSIDIHDGVEAIDVGGLDTGQSVTTILYSVYNGGDMLSERHIIQFPPGHAGRQAAKLTFARGSFDLAYAYAAADDALLATQDTYTRSRMILERLHDPFMLDDGMRDEFKRRIRRAVPATVIAFGKCGFPQGIDLLYEEGVIDADNIDALIEEASDEHEIAVLSRLMQLKRTAFDTPMFDFDL